MTSGNTLIKLSQGQPQRLLNRTGGGSVRKQTAPRDEVVIRSTLTRWQLWQMMNMGVITVRDLARIAGKSRSWAQAVTDRRRSGDAVIAVTPSVYAAVSGRVPESERWRFAGRMPTEHQMSELVSGAVVELRRWS